MNEKVSSTKSVGVQPPGLHPGAVWKRVDFQVHTPRDTQWKGATFSGNSEEDRRKRIDWAKALIREARKRGLDAIAITDHHDLAYIEVVRTAVRELGEELKGEFWVFPGMEVTCDDSCQCLVLLNPDTQVDQAERLYGSGFLNVKKHPYEHEKLPQTAVSGINLDKLVDHLSKDASLKDCSLVLPHAGKDKAHKTIFREGFHARFAKLSCDGFYIEHPFTELDPKHLRRLRGEDANWGNRRRGVFSTGDNRSEDFDRLGVNPCWMRMGESTVESIRQALLADEARITFSEPSVPSQRVLAIEVHSTLCGKNLHLSFNDGFTAVIGGRGTGKSAVLEYLRFGIGRAVFDLKGDHEGEASRLVDLINDTLPGGYVKVRLIRDGIEEVWTRRYDDYSVIEVKRKNESVENITPEVAQERFHARGYHQKQLSTLRALSAAQVDQITGIAAAELVAEQGVKAQQITNAVTALGISFKKLVQRWEIEAQIERTSHRIQDLQSRRQVLQETLQAKGVSSAAQETLKVAPEYTKGKQYFTDTQEELDVFVTEINALQESLSDRLSDPVLSDLADFEPIRKASALVTTFKNEVVSKLGDVVSKANQLKSAVEAEKKKFDASLGTFNERYKKAQAEQRAHKELLDSLVKLNKELEEAEKNQKASTEQGNKLKNAEADFAKARNTLDNLYHARRELLEKAAEHSNTKSEHRLRASVFPYIPSETQEASLSSLLEGSHARGVEEQLRTYLQSSTPQSWRSFCDGLINLYRHKILRTYSGAQQAADSETVAPVKQLFSFANLNDRMADHVWQRLIPEKVEAVLLAVPNAHIKFEYKDQSGQFISFNQASPGQQAAALLTLLLNQHAGTLIIDQPEEDLDNRIIMDVVRLLRTTKKNRQLIFATHNANFVVNGDADKVVVVGAVGSHGAGKSEENKVAIAVDGAIETPSVRDAITTIMEGGKEAFELRGRKYAFKGESPGP
jgi:chromosome segregation protein